MLAAVRVIHAGHTNWHVFWQIMFIGVPIWAALVLLTWKRGKR